MSSAQERAAEVIQQHSIECTGLGGVTCGGCRDADWMSWFAYRRHLAAALAEANLLVDDDTARLVERGRQAEEADAHVDELLASVTDEDREQFQADIRRQARHLALGRAVEGMRHINSGYVDYIDGWNHCLDAIYREAGVEP